MEKMLAGGSASVALVNQCSGCHLRTWQANSCFSGGEKGAEHDILRQFGPVGRSWTLARQGQRAREGEYE